VASHLHVAPDPPGPPAAPPIWVALADDHALMRTRLRLLLDAEEDIEVVAESGSVAAAVNDVHRRQPHVLVIDLAMPGGSTLAAIAALREQVPGTEVVVLTMEQSPEFARQALNAGAIGFVLKDRADSDLPPAVRRAARREQYLSPLVVERIAARE
jgi:two-component system response regulator NreC